MRRRYFDCKQYKYHLSILPAQGESYNIVFQDAMGGGIKETSLNWNNGDGDIDITLPYNKAKISLYPHSYSTITTPEVEYDQYSTDTFLMFYQNPSFSKADRLVFSSNPCQITIEVQAEILAPIGLYERKDTVVYKKEKINPVSQTLVADHGMVSVVGKTISTPEYTNSENVSNIRKVSNDANVTAFLVTGDIVGESTTLSYNNGVFEGSVKLGAYSTKCDLVGGSPQLFVDVTIENRTKQLTTYI